jgi:hypothetical protein
MPGRRKKQEQPIISRDLHEMAYNSEIEMKRRRVQELWGLVRSYIRKII